MAKKCNHRAEDGLVSLSDDMVALGLSDDVVTIFLSAGLMILIGLAVLWLSVSALVRLWGLVF